MVAKKKKDAPAGWGATDAPAFISTDAPAGISTNPEDRQPPEEEEGRPVMGMPAAEPIGQDNEPVAEPAPKKTKKQKAEAAADEVIKTVPKAKGGNTDPLISIVERIERLDEERRTITDDMKEVFAEAKGNGYNVAIIRKVLSRRRMDVEARQELDALIELYEGVLG